MASRRVAITGMGAIAATGDDMAAVWAAMLRGDCGIRPITTIDAARLSVRTAAEIRGFDPARHFAEKRLPMLDRTAQFALVAAREAARDGDLASVPPRRGGVVLGAALGQTSFEDAYRGFYQDGTNRFPPLTLPRCMPSAAASLVSMEFSLRGACFATASACASSAHAIGVAFHMVRSGMLDVALAGGADASITPGYLKAWEAMRVLSPEACRPFSRDRTGLVIGEGAAIVLLEEFSRAAARGATVYAELVGFGMSADAADITAPSETGAAQAMRDALDDAGIAADAVGYINAHGTGTRLNDRTECAAIGAVFGGRTPPASSSKSMLGHCLCASGALGFVSTVLALRHGVLPPTMGFRAADPECPIDCVPNEARPASVAVAMANAFAFGGLNATLLARRA
jgi:nodulation protein E